MLVGQEAGIGPSAVNKKTRDLMSRLSGIIRLSRAWQHTCFNESPGITGVMIEQGVAIHML